MHQTCIYYNGGNAKNGWGFCDLYNSRTGEVWELKKDSESLSCLHENAYRQLCRYVAGRLKHNLQLELKFPDETAIEKGSFYFTNLGYEYSVTYWYEGEGILRYSYDVHESKERIVVEAAVVIGVAVGFAIAGPAAVPALVLLG